MTNAHLFRRLAFAEDAMVRAAMPRTADADPIVNDRAVREVVARRWGTRLVRAVPAPTLTATLAERMAS